MYGVCNIDKNLAVLNFRLSNHAFTVLQRIYVLLSIIVIALLTTQRDANGDDTESFSACSRVAEAVNQKIHKSGSHEHILSL